MQLKKAFIILATLLVSARYSEAVSISNGSRTVAVTSSNALAVSGPTANGVANADNPVKQGLVAHTALPTAVTDNQIVDSMGDKYGRRVTILDCPRDLIVSSTATLTNNTGEVVFLSSGAANVFNDLTNVIVVNTSGTAARIDFRSVGGPSGGNITFPIYVPAGETRGWAGSHLWPQATAASNWTIQSSASVTDIRIAATFCQNK